MPKQHQICKRCVMDTTDPDISFDLDGICNHCRTYDEIAQKEAGKAVDRPHALEEVIRDIKREGSGKEYDCVIGVSGGVDSTYVAYKVKELGLRPLAVHLDNGWDSELAVQNIENVLRLQDIDLHTHVIDWEEFRDLQLAFLRASTPDSEIPTDHAIFTLLREVAHKYRLNYIITGINYKTESHGVRAWSQGHYDWKYIKSIHKQFGNKRLRTFPHMSLFKLRWYWKSQKLINLLDYINYSKEEAVALLENRLGWTNYGGKHYESIYTRFFQGYILPKKFGFDKRKMHLSSLICSGEITRDQALQELQKEPYPLELQLNDREYVIKKFGLSEEAFEEIMNLPRKTYWDYPSYGRMYRSFLYKTVHAAYKLFSFRHKPGYH